MSEEIETVATNRVEPRITVQATDIDGIAAALGLELLDASAPAESPAHSEELRDVLDTLADSYGGVQEATETDSRGRSRKMVRQYAGREDLSSEGGGPSPPRPRGPRTRDSRW